MADDPLFRYVMSQYPKQVNLGDGSTVTLRALFVPQDRGEVGQFFERVPEEDRAFLKEDLLDREEVETWLDGIDSDRETVIVAIVDGRIVGTAVLKRQRHGWARRVGEVRIVAEPAFRRRGLGHVLPKPSCTSPRRLDWKRSWQKWFQTAWGRFASLSGSVSGQRPCSTTRSRTAMAESTTSS
jgi:GNAT superfamily N-acetyltransferase